MTTMINVNGSDDPFYRYKMPAIESTCTGHGTHGKWTAIHNLGPIARSLRRDPAHLGKHLALASSTRCKTEPSGGVLLGGWYTSSELQASLAHFIGAFVLCSACGDPGTEVVLKAASKKNKTIELHCKACGATSSCPPGKLMTFIANSVGSAGLHRHARQETADATEEAADTKTDGHGGVDVPLSAEAASESPTDDNAAADQARASVAALLPGAGTPEEQQLPSALAQLVPSLMSEADVVGFAVEAWLAHERGPLRKLWCVHGEPTPLARAVRAVSGTAAKAQRRILRALEALASGAHGAAVLRELSPMLQALYEADVLDEDAILGWAAKTKHAASRRAAARMVEWLQEAEEED